MPVENIGQSIAGEPDNQSSIQSPGVLPAGQGPPAPGAGDGARRNPNDPQGLEKEIRIAEYWLVGIGVATILLNIGIATIYYGQLGQMREATQAATRAASTASDSFEISDGNFERMMAQPIHQTSAQIQSSEASEGAVKLARDQTRLDQRAWVGVKDVIDIQFSDAPSPISARIPITNYGKTPARAVFSQNILHATDVPIDPVEYMKHPIEAGGEKSWNVIFPNQTLYFRSATGYTDALGVESAKSGRKLLYLFMAINYEDVFGSHHLTRVCARYDAKAKLFSACPGDYDYAD